MRGEAHHSRLRERGCKMTIGELIQKLQAYDHKTQVYVGMMADKESYGAENIRFTDYGNTSDNFVEILSA